MGKGVRLRVAYCTSPGWQMAECEAVGGMEIGRENGSTRGKPAPVPLCPPQIPGLNPSRRGGKPATNRLS
jgi:hypothetical protein